MNNTTEEEMPSTSRRLTTSGRRWAVLNYIVSEPEEWTCRKIAEDLGDSFHGITEAVLSLTKKGLVVKGKKEGRSFTYFPTPEGVELLHRSLEK